jgi:NAD(P)H-hydrate epimerase
MVVAGSKNYIGAAYLACSGAYRAGAGLVTLATAGSLTQVIASRLAEATYLPLPESAPGVVAEEAAVIIVDELEDYNVLLAGCGLGQRKTAVEMVGSLLLTGKKLPQLVLDADALNILANTSEWWCKLPDGSVLTPHPGEMARLTGLETAEIQADRPGIARRFAAEWNQTVVLKGAYSVIAAADGRCFICPLANTGLATAGTGDVLAGVIAGLVAQGMDGFDAAVLGVWLHAKAGEMVKDEIGDAGMLAGDLLPVLPRVIKGIKEE